MIYCKGVLNDSHIFSYSIQHYRTIFFKHNFPFFEDIRGKFLFSLYLTYIYGYIFVFLCVNFIKTNSDYMVFWFLYLYLLWRNTLTHLWSGGSEWNTLAHECARTLGSLWFFGHQEPSQRQRALNWIANSDAPETWGDDACAIHGASTSGRMQFENLARHSRCIWFSQAQSFS